MSSPAEPRPVRAVIVDDEPLARDCVRIALARLGEVEVVAECADGEAAVEAILEHRPDLVFLDVQMPGLDGFGVVERVGAARMPAVVFVTAFEEHALRAFEVHAADYVLKPFDDARFGDAVRHARRQRGAEAGEEIRRTLEALLRDYRGGEGQGAAVGGRPVTRFMVQENDRIHFVATDEVDWLEAAGNYVRVHAGSRSHLIRATLTGIAAQLDGSRFVRIHRSTVVNVDRIKEVQPWFGGDYVAILRDGQQLRVSRNYRDALLRPLS
ncbi:MAG TPA: LytTR family DNA-binding domain-containing protein [Longimicrobium sp.]|nr:LytTR family DNA-binding domain-containing protein [Longimicrobium sp.]